MKIMWFVPFLAQISTGNFILQRRIMIRKKATKLNWITLSTPGRDPINLLKQKQN